ncbi:DUF1302 family protein [Candidatus Margulisiibacteriota bacterium]
MLIFILISSSTYALDLRGSFNQQYYAKLKAPAYLMGDKLNVFESELTCDLGRQASCYLLENIFFVKNNDMYDISIEIRELYIDYYSQFGDFKIGKQIISWGMADEHNPMDNINPEDFRNPFLPKSDRKIGVWAVRSDLYINDYNLQLVWAPYFESTVLPLSGSDTSIFPFPAAVLALDPAEPETSMANSQYGIRLLSEGRGFDYSLSYYDGYEKIFTPQMSGMIISGLFYNRIKVIGADFAANIFDFDVRGEAAYFMTADSDGTDTSVRNPYYQYIIGAAYTFEDDLKVGINYAEEIITMIDDSAERNIEAANIPRAGMQLSIFTAKALAFLCEKEFTDDNIKVRVPLVLDLENGGCMTSPEVSWSPQDALNCAIGLVILDGSDSSLLGSMRNNSQFYFKLEQSF